MELDLGMDERRIHILHERELTLVGLMLWVAFMVLLVSITKTWIFSKVMKCQKNPIINDLPSQNANDSEVGKTPYCYRNGSILPTIMDRSKPMSLYQMQVFKIPPVLKRTALYHPEKWKTMGS